VLFALPSRGHPHSLVQLLYFDRVARRDFGSEAQRRTLGLLAEPQSSHMIVEGRRVVVVGSCCSLVLVEEQLLVGAQSR
jgi:hypothetical protein